MIEYKLSSGKEKALKKITNLVLADVKPSLAEARSLATRINTVMGRLKKVVPKGIEIIVAGSSARGTNLAGNSDIDIFLLFKNPVPKQKMEKSAIEIAKKVVKDNKKDSYIVKYAEHPYARLFLDEIGLKVDLVPAYKISSSKEKITSVDRTQLHNEFVKSSLNTEQQDEVRILKAFLKFHGIYGAEAKIEGFSGYLCELLICAYGSFPKLLVAMANSKVPVVVNFTYSQHDPKELEKKFGKKLIVIDPTDEDRNVAANVSEESFARFVLLSRSLISQPSIECFNGPKHSEVDTAKELSKITKELGVELHAICFESDDISDEIVWQQLKRVMIGINSELAKLGFPPLISLQDVDGTSSVLGFLINGLEKRYKIVVGPSANMRDAANAFLESHTKHIFGGLEGDRLYVVEKADATTPTAALKWVLDNKIKIPSHLGRKIKIYQNRVPERYSRMLYRAYFKKTNL